MIIDPARVVPMVSQMISGRHFSDAPLGRAFDALVSLHNAGRKIDDVTLVVRELSSMGVLSGREIVQYASELPHAAHATDYADQILICWRLRGIAGAAERLNDQINTPNMGPDDVLAWLEGEMMALRHGAPSRANEIGDAWDSVLERLQSYVTDGRRQVLLSGLPHADELGFVFSPGELVVLAARPGIGKTTLATQIGIHHAGRGRAVLMASLEMKAEDVAIRLLAAADGANHHHLRTGQITQSDVDSLRATRAGLGSPPFIVWAPGRVKAGAIHAAASVHKATHDIGLLIVDYIGLVKPDDHSRQRYEQVGQVTKALRDIGQQLQIPVLALCQLNREGGKQRPNLTNLKESGAIEEDADIVAFLHPESDGQHVELIVDKNRQGSRGSTRLRFEAVSTQFKDYSGGSSWTPNGSRHRDYEDFA